MQNTWKQNTSLLKLFKISFLSVFIFTSFVGYQVFSNWLFGTTGGVTEGKQQGDVKGVTSKNDAQRSPDGSVKAVADNITDNSLVFRLKVFFLDAIEASSARFDADLEVGNNVTIGNDLLVGGILISEDGIEAPNLLYSIVAGAGLSVS